MVSALGELTVQGRDRPCIHSLRPLEIRWGQGLSESIEGAPGPAGTSEGLPRVDPCGTQGMCLNRCLGGAYCTLMLLVTPDRGSHVPFHEQETDHQERGRDVQTQPGLGPSSLRPCTAPSLTPHGSLCPLIRTWAPLGRNFCLVLRNCLVHPRVSITTCQEGE